MQNTLSSFNFIFLNTIILSLLFLLFFLFVLLVFLLCSYGSWTVMLVI